MSEEALTDDQSHYEVSLTAGQAFLAFVLLLLSLAASFAFGLMIGKGQGDSSFLARREPAVVTEPPTAARKQVAEVPVASDDFQAADVVEQPKQKAVPPPVITEEAM